MDEYRAALDAAHRLALQWLDSLATRPVPGRASVESVAEALGDLPERPRPADEVVAALADAVEPGLTAIGSGRWYGMVMGGTHPAALAADWLTSAWDQNSALRAVTPGTVAVEDVVDRWLLDLLRLPPTAGVGIVTGATMANWTCLATARDAVLRGVGWDVADRGLSGSPGVRALVGAERHDSVDSALRYLGLGRPEPVEADDQGRLRVDALADALAGDGRPTVVALQAGNVHSGAFDDFAAAIAVAHEAGAWVHVDGAFGLFAAASERLRHLVAGADAADSWTTDAHKTLNVPYDCGIAIVRDAAAMRASMGMRGEYLIQDETGGDPFDRVPEMSRRARAVPVWAVLAALGRQGVAELVERFCRHAQLFAEGIAGIPGAEVLNDVVFTQVCAGFGSDERTRSVVAGMLADGTAWTSGSRWHSRAVLRIALCNWQTTDADVQATLDALRRAAS